MRRSMPWGSSHACKADLHGHLKVIFDSEELRSTSADSGFNRLHLLIKYSRDERELVKLFLPVASSRECGL